MRTIIMIMMLIVVAYSANNKLTETFENLKARKQNMEYTQLASNQRVVY